MKATTKTVFRKGRIGLAVMGKNGREDPTPQRVDGLIHEGNQLAIAPWDNAAGERAGWSVTHIASGYSVIERIVTVGQAMAICIRLAALDWSGRTVAKITANAQIKDQVRKERELLRHPQVLKFEGVSK